MLFKNILLDIACISCINYIILVMYRLSYKKEAMPYLDSQLRIIGTSGMSCSLVLNIYYYLENKYSIDTYGLMLILAFLFGGLLSNYLYKHYFHLKTSRFQPTDSEYLFMISIAFGAISVRMAIHNIISIIIPLALLSGRYIWLDTKTIKEIFTNLKTNHNRIIESSILFLLGLILPSLLVAFLHIHRSWEIIVLFGYGLIIIFPYRYIRKLIQNKYTL